MTIYLIEMTLFFFAVSKLQGNSRYEFVSNRRSDPPPLPPTPTPQKKGGGERRKYINLYENIGI